MGDNQSSPPPPPPSKRKRRKKRPEPTPEELERIENKQNIAAALYQGFLLYMREPAMSIRAVWETGRLDDKDDDSPPLRECVSLPHFLGTASKNNWRERRDQHWREVRSRVEAHLMTQHVRRELEEVAVLEALKSAVLPHIMGGELTLADGSVVEIRQAKPKSLEGAVDAFVKLDKRIGDKRQHVINEAGRASAGDLHDSPHDGVVGHVEDERGGPAVLMDTDGYEDDEIEAMAEALAARRVVKQNAHLRESAKVDGVDTDDAVDTAEDE